MPLTQCFPNLNPHPCLQEMKLLAETSESTDPRTIYTAFVPFLTSASHEEWHLLIQHTWHNILGPTELKLFNKLGELINLAKAQGMTYERVEMFRNQGFAMPVPSVNFISCEATFSGISRRALLVDLMKILVLREQKRVLVVKTEEALEKYGGAVPTIETAQADSAENEVEVLVKMEPNRDDSEAKVKIEP